MHAPDFSTGNTPLRLVDLFAGCGGLSLGIAQALSSRGRALDVRLAVDFESLATAVYADNFPNAAHVETSAVESIFDGELGSLPTLTERGWLDKVGVVDALVGGPPCQGHSSLNNHTRGDDPKNGLYLHMVRAAELLRPSIVLIENVPAVMKDRYQGQNVVNMARNRLQDLDYRVHDAVVSMDGLGVAQTRKRHILLATTEGWAAPQDVFSALKIMDNTHDLRWAIGDLENVQPVGFDSPPSAKQINLDRMKYLLDNDVYDLPNDLRPVCHQDDHSYKSMYGRLRWDKPAQTITSGFGSIGQGRYMHPSRMSALTPHEAARLQGFPDYFDFSAVGTRTGLATMIGNAVPPQLGASIFEALLRSLRDTGVAASDDIPLAWSA